MVNQAQGCAYELVALTGQLIKPGCRWRITTIKGKRRSDPVPSPQLIKPEEAGRCRKSG
jgi:hypothetical protein